MTITSRTNPLITEICALKDRKKREESGLFFFEGRKLLREAFRQPAFGPGMLERMRLMHCYQSA